MVDLLRGRHGWFWLVDRNYRGFVILAILIWRTKCTGLNFRTVLSLFEESTMRLASVTSMTSEQDPNLDRMIDDHVVEIGILLPANRAADLIQMARVRQESVGQMLRKLIDRELSTSDIF